MSTNVCVLHMHSRQFLVQTPTENLVVTVTDTICFDFSLLQKADLECCATFLSNR